MPSFPDLKDTVTVVSVVRCVLLQELLCVVVFVTVLKGVSFVISIVTWR